MAIQQLNNGESGFDVRQKINNNFAELAKITAASNTTAGTGSEYTVNNASITDYDESLIYKIKFHLTNLENATLRINALADLPLFDKTGVAIEPGQLLENTAYLFSYNSNSGSPYWQLLGEGESSNGNIGSPRQVNAKWEPDLMQFYLIDIEGAFNLTLKSDSETGGLSWKRRIKPNLWDDNSGNLYSTTEINNWGTLRENDETEIAAIPIAPDFDIDNDGVFDIETVGCIIEITIP